MREPLQHQAMWDRLDEASAIGDAAKATTPGWQEEVDALRAELAGLRAEVREWLCEKCSTVFPGPPSEGFGCVICPVCGGNTKPRGSAELDSLRAQVARYNEMAGKDADELARLRAEMAVARKFSRRWKADAKAHRATIAELNETIQQKSARLAAATKRAENAEADIRDTVALAQAYGWNGVENSKILCIFLLELIGDIERQRDALAAALDGSKNCPKCHGFGYVDGGGPRCHYETDSAEERALTDMWRRVKCDCRKVDPVALLSARDAAQRRAGAVWGIRKCCIEWIASDKPIESVAEYLVSAIERGEVEVPE